MWNMPRAPYADVVGAGLLVATCDDGPEPQPEYGAPMYGAPGGTSTATVTGAGGGGGQSAMGGAGGAGGGEAGAPQTDYMAPDP